ncbi:methyltransferase domain-containing protein [Ferrovibrio sp. MS7]|uniref:class I SAM-dependent methyltransferase n=1 Tax=Ferrovibrio plantarum TaxID=3119164 RepID=UPI0031358245
MDQDEYDRMAAVEETLWWYRALHRIQQQRLAALRLAPTGHVLDAGCGTGGLLRFLRQQMPALVLHGLEFNAEAAGMARAKSGLPVTEGSVNAMPFGDAAFDAIVSDDVLCHAGVDQAAALAEFLRCLKPGGRLLLNLPAYSWMNSPHDIHVHNVRRYTKRQAMQRLRQAGFAIEAAGYWNSLLFPLMLLHRMSVGKMQTASDVRPLAPWLNTALFSIARQEEWLNRYGLGLPFGGSVWLQARRA